MKNLTKFISIAIVAATATLGASTASAWWGNDDYWGGPWGYPGYGYGGYPGYGYGGYPGYGGYGGYGGYPGYGWGGYPGYGGYGGYPGYGGYGGYGGYPGYGYSPAAPVAPATTTPAQ